jgi:hypothetical protein
MICDFNFCPTIQNRVSEFSKIDPKNLYVHKAINDWSSILESNVDKIKYALKNAGG